jgi:hypothetical protein
MIKKVALLFLLFFISILTLYLIFLSIISIFIGLINIERYGFWTPILFGLLILVLTIFLIRLIRYIFQETKVKDKYPYD